MITGIIFFDIRGTYLYISTKSVKRIKELLAFDLQAGLFQQERMYSWKKKHFGY
jgi:hypothetical protein